MPKFQQPARSKATESVKSSGSKLRPRDNKHQQQFPEKTSSAESTDIDAEEPEPEPEPIEIPLLYPEDVPSDYDPEEPINSLEANLIETLQRTPIKGIPPHLQLQDLVLGINCNAIFTGQASDGVPLAKDEIIPFLRIKLARQRSKLEKILPEHMERVLRKCRGDEGAKCMLIKPALQIKIPCGTMRPGPSDRRRGFVRGVIRIQSRKLAYFLDMHDDIETLLVDMGYKILTNATAINVCGRCCLAPGHWLMR